MSCASLAFARNQSIHGQLGRIIVLPVDELKLETEQIFSEPPMLLALNATDAVEWEELDNRVCCLLWCFFGVLRFCIGQSSDPTLGKTPK